MRLDAVSGSALSGHLDVPQLPQAFQTRPTSTSANSRNSPYLNSRQRFPLVVLVVALVVALVIVLVVVPRPRTRRRIRRHTCRRPLVAVVVVVLVELVVLVVALVVAFADVAVVLVSPSMGLWGSGAIFYEVHGAIRL